MKFSLIGLAGIVAAASTSQAAFFLEAEGNNTSGTANPVGVYAPPGDAFLVDGSISPLGDQDWFIFSVTGPAEIKAAVYGRPNSTIGDSFLELYDAVPALITSDDDDNIGKFSSLEANVPAGTYYLRVLAGPRSTSIDATFDYKLVVGINIVPAPGSLCVAGLGGLMAARRKRS
ncbi:MAG: hypothetical protein JNM07_00485 [Phycisphaerae bacterium]|nr:hypothetical protein [Phycisphaerae bacterium]